MANYYAIKAAVNAYIKQNGRKEITGSILNAVLNATIDSLGRFFQFAGGAMPTDDPGTPDQNVCYLATEPGLYTHFGNIRIANEEVALLFWNGEWVKESIALGIQEVNASVDNQVGTPSVDVSYSGGQLVLTFHNLKGEQGIQGIQGIQGEQGIQGIQGEQGIQGVKGDTGDAAGFGTIGADINGGVGTPGVSVETSGNNTAKNLMFHFTNLKGETGVTSVIATVDNTTGTPACQVSLVNGVLTLAFSGLKGLKGDTGVSADYPITIYNGLDSDATDQALAAAQGKVLDGKISQLQQKVGIIETNIGDVPPAQMSKDMEYSKENSTFWDSYSASAPDYSTNSTSPFFVNSKKQGLVTSFTALFSSTGKLTIGKVKKTDVIPGQAFDLSKLLARRVYNIESTGEQTISIEPFYIDDTEMFAVGATTDTAIFKYGGNGGDVGFKYVRNGIVSSSSKRLGITFNGFTYIFNASEVVKNGFLASEIIQDIVGLKFVDGKLYNGYSSQNGAASTPNTAPFVIIKTYNRRSLVKSITLRIHTIGVLTIGKIKRSDVVEGDNYDRSKVFDKLLLTFTSTGEQTMNVPRAWNNEIKTDEYLVVCDTTDTAIFYFGPVSPRDTGFIYCASNGKWTRSNLSMGVDINVTFIESVSSTYKGKRISILGDSISTFAGYIPEGNATYYPAGTVQSVQDTWWKKLIDALGLVLDTNNSWSGSRVTTTGGETSAGCMTRSQSLGSPDVIIVWMGINDFNNEVALGTYDGKSEIPTATTTFREAYGIMLNKILTAYPSAEVWVCTLPQCERNGTTGFPEVNGNGVALLDFNIAIEELARAFGVKVLDHNRCGLTYQNMSVFNPDQLHPNKYGHSLVANNDIRQMDNCVSTRYAIAE